MRHLRITKKNDRGPWCRWEIVWDFVQGKIFMYFTLQIFSQNTYFTCMYVYVVFQLQCCGVRNYSDYFYISAWPTQRRVPDSCCKQPEEGCGQREKRFWFERVKHYSEDLAMGMITWMIITVIMVWLEILQIHKTNVESTSLWFESYWQSMLEVSILKMMALTQRGLIALFVWTKDGRVSKTVGTPHHQTFAKTVMTIVLITLKGAIQDFNTISSLHRKLSPKCTLKCKSCAAHWAHIAHKMSYTLWYKGTVYLLSLKEMKSHLF